MYSISCVGSDVYKHGENKQKSFRSLSLSASAPFFFCSDAPCQDHGGEGGYGLQTVFRGSKEYVTLYVSQRAIVKQRRCWAHSRSTPVVCDSDGHNKEGQQSEAALSARRPRGSYHSRLTPPWAPTASGRQPPRSRRRYWQSKGAEYCCRLLLCMPPGK